MKLDFKINHTATLDNPFPTDLVIGSYMSGKLGVLRLHNAVCIINPIQSSYHWVMFFEPVDGHYNPFRSFTRLSAYQRYIREGPDMVTHSRWLSPYQNPDAIMVRVILTRYYHGSGLKLTYTPSHYDETWFSPDTPLSDFHMLPVQQVIEKLWKRQHYYKHYIERSI